MSESPSFDLTTSAGGRGYIAHLFKTVLQRHDYTRYINERLAVDFACTLAQHFEDIKARELALQLRLNAADQRVDDLAGTCEWTQEDDSGIWNSACGATWSFHEDGPTENGMNFCHCCGMKLAIEDPDVADEPIDDWHMNPCSQGTGMSARTAALPTATPATKRSRRPPRKKPLSAGTRLTQPLSQPNLDRSTFVLHPAVTPSPFKVSRYSGKEECRQ